MKKTNSTQQQFQKNFLWNLAGTTLNALTSFVYMIVVTRINGLETAGVFSFAFSNACVLVVIGMYMGRTYQISDNKVSDKTFIRARQLTCGVMFLIAVVMGAWYRFSLDSFLVFMLWNIYKMCEAYSDVLYGIMQKEDHLDYVGKSLVLKSAGSVCVFIILDYVFKNIVIASMAALVISFCVIVLYDLHHYRREEIKRESFHMDDCLFIIKDGFFVFGTTLLITYLVNASKYAINNTGTDAEQAVYGILVMPATALILVGQYLIQPFLMKLKNLYLQKEGKKLTKTIVSMCGILCAVGAIGVICGGTIGIPVLELVYGVELGTFRNALMIIMAGATSYGCIIILTNVLTLMHKNKIQLLYFACISLIVTLVSGMAVRKSGVLGATIVYCGSMMVSVLMLGIIAQRGIRKECNR